MKRDGVKDRLQHGAQVTNLRGDRAGSVVVHDSPLVLVRWQDGRETRHLRAELLVKDGAR